MENYEETIRDQSPSEGEGGGTEWLPRDICLPKCADSWRRVFNRTLGCYEIYVRRSNVLVATGIGSESDSFAIGSLPATYELLTQLLNQIESGDVSKETYKAARYILSRWKSSFRKGEGVGRVDLLRLDSDEFNLDRTGGGSYTEAGLFPK